jgi:hypothetical protein
MARVPHTIKQGDVSRAVKAVKAAGVKFGRVEIDFAAGKITVFSDDGKPQEFERSALDRWRDGRGAG